MGLGQLYIDLELTTLERAIRRYVDELGLDLPRVVKQTFRLIMKDVSDFTAPKSQAQGRKAVKRDIGRAVYLVDYTKIKVRMFGGKEAALTKSKNLRTAVQDREYDVVRAMFKNKHVGDWNKISQLVPFSPSLHERARDARGRVRRSKGVATLDRQAYLRYVRDTQKRVGYTRSGWAPGTRLAGASVPAWVARHTSPPGRASESLTAEKPTMTAIHQGKTTNAISKDKVEQIVKRRAKVMEKDVSQVLKGRASRYFDTA